MKPGPSLVIINPQSGTYYRSLSFYHLILAVGAAVIFLPHSLPVRRWQNAHDLVAGFLAAERAVIHPSPQSVAALEEKGIGLLPVFAQAPRKQFELEFVHVVLHIQRQVQSHEKVLLRVLLRGKFGADEIDEHHGNGVTEGGG